MAEGITYLCPSCGAYLRYDGGQGRWVCDYCDSSYTKEELEQRGADTENTGYTVSPGDSGKTETVDFACEENVAEGMDQEHLRAYSCPNCGDLLRVLWQSHCKSAAVQRKISSLRHDPLCNG